MSSLMVQGTTSNAGKSVLVTGLCRLFASRGYRVAPFKPQNMALNSAVTIDGGEIGRSQAVQALACGVEPHSDMNPILLKPNSDKGAQVIINGHAIGNMDAREYHEFKKEALDYALASYRRLQASYDLVIVEGAGSPAEINLRDNDVANMGFALATDTPVVVVADIDRGGVFAHLSGTMDCLSPEERELVKGFLINRFRGDRSLLDSGVDWLTAKTGIDTLGVLPYLKGLHIEAEDAVDHRQAGEGGDEQVLRIVVPRIPRISNHTDFDVLRLQEDIELTFVDEGDPRPPCDLVILPGSKSTISDLRWLRDNGWEDYLKRHLRYGGKLIGICGGYQMIGRLVHDPQGLEGDAGSVAGLGIMDFETTLEPHKQLHNVSGSLLLDDTPVEIKGYEIHMGSTRGIAEYRPAVDLGSRQDGVISADNQVICSYLHGFFDAAPAREALLRWAGHRSVRTAFDYDALRERQIDRVAHMLDDELDFKRLLETTGLF